MMAAPENAPENALLTHPVTPITLTVEPVIGGSCPWRARRNLSAYCRSN